MYENYDLFKTTIQNIDLMNLNMLFNESEKKELLLIKYGKTQHNYHLER